MKTMWTGSLGVLLISACSPGPITFVSMTPSPSDGAFSCALRQLNTMGYKVTNNYRDVGYITAEKPVYGVAMKILTLGMASYQNALNISVFDGADGHQNLRVTAAFAEKNWDLFSTKRTAEKPSKAGIADAKAVLSACGQGEVKQRRTHVQFSPRTSVTD